MSPALIGPRCAYHIKTPADKFARVGQTTVFMEDNEVLSNIGSVEEIDMPFRPAVRRPNNDAADRPAQSRAGRIIDQGVRLDDCRIPFMEYGFFVCTEPVFPSAQHVFRKSPWQCLPLMEH